MPLPPPPAINVERMIISATRTEPPAEIRVYATRTHQNGRESIRGELNSATVTDIYVNDTATGELLQTITLQPGSPTFWPGPTAADKVSLGGNRSFADTRLTVTL
jgi:hypothetical protein